MGCELIRSRGRPGSGAKSNVGGEVPVNRYDPDNEFADLSTQTSWRAFACWAFVVPRHETR